MLQKALFICGIFSAVIWVAADLIASSLYEGYSYAGQAVSELSAIGSPVRDLVVGTNVFHTITKLAFGVGVWMASAGRRGLRVAGALLEAMAVVDFVAYFFPMTMRQDLGLAVAMPLTDIMHIVITGITVLLILLAVGFAARAFGMRWLIYSVVTIVLMVAGGVLASLDAPGIAANQPTPWLGITERVNIYAFLLWMAALSIALLSRPMPNEISNR